MAHLTHLTIKLDENGVPIIEKAKKAIAAIESAGSGDYKAIGPQTKKGDRAYGRYQVMGENIPSWTKEVLGVSMTPKQFLNSPEAQDRVFEAKFGGNMEKYGPEGAARAWFTGSPTGRGKDILGTSAEQYVNKFSSAFGGSPTVPMTPGRFGIPNPSQVTPAMGDVVDINRFVHNPDLLADRQSKLGSGMKFGGGKYNWRSQADVDRYGASVGLKPDTLKAVTTPPATVTPLAAAKPTITTNQPAQPAQPWMKKSNPALVGMGARIQAAIKGGADKRMLAAWVEAIKGAQTYQDANRGVEQLSKLLDDLGY